MIPDLPNISDPVLMADFLRPYNRHKTNLTDYARGGVALLDASKGLDVKDWFCEANDNGVFLSASGSQMLKIETLPGKITWISLAFDQNMHYNLAYSLLGAGAFFYWYDAERQSYVTDSLGNIKTPIARMDDVRRYAIGSNDIVLSYIRGTSLCVRIQRDRYKQEYVLASNAGNSILQCGMNKVMRFQWNCI